MTVPSFQSFWNIKFFCVWDISHHRNKTKTEWRDTPSPTHGNTLEYSYLWYEDSWFSPTVTVYSDSSKEDFQVPYVCPSSLTLIWLKALEINRQATVLSLYKTFCRSLKNPFCPNSGRRYSLVTAHHYWRSASASRHKIVDRRKKQKQESWLWTTAQVAAIKETVNKSV